MNRRDFIASSGAAVAGAAWPIRAGAQVTGKPVIGLLFVSNPEPPNGLIRAALAGRGFRNGETIQYELRVADSSDARLAEMAADLVARKVDIIIAFTTPAVAAAKAATGTIPIIMASAADPVGSGLVASLSRPGGNVTGVDGAVSQLAGALLGLLREAIPSASRIGLLANVTDPYHRRLIETIVSANRVVNVDLRVFSVATPGEIEATFERMAAEKLDAAIIQPTLPRLQVISLANRHKLATGCPVIGYAHQGGLMSYSARPSALYEVAAAQVEQVLKGVKPADIPVRQPTQFNLALNLKTARALGIEIAPMILAQADDVIE